MRRRLRTLLLHPAECARYQCRHPLPALVSTASQLLLGRQASLDGLDDRHFDLFRGHPRRGRIQDAASGRGQHNAVADGPLIRPHRPNSRVNLYAWDRRKVTPGSGNREVDGVWNHVAEAQEVQRALVRDYCNVPANGEPSSKHVLTRRRRVFPEAVEATPDPDEITALDVVREQRPTEPADSGLFSSEIAATLRGYFEKRAQSGLEADGRTRGADLMSLIPQMSFDVLVTRNRLG